MLVSESKITTNIKITLNENEARALEALAGYGDDSFLEMFYKQLGKHYMAPHESGLRSLFQGIRDNLPRELKKVDQARKAIGSK